VYKQGRIRGGKGAEKNFFDKLPFPWEGLSFKIERGEHGRAAIPFTFGRDESAGPSRFFGLAESKG